ncbi:probable sodium-coupled neutral amino acid transporter 6 [Phalaenopsis equestris]|uniref:probable sodium-coupled neutral amino acid transporter 6 n=1 Tax=Phalaenopsis equestris TaxID=78828 RepID=UPI0009E2C7FC|nr:probable sodium-coupled neutral amino acid transporter 6 [Phalaenopsis equestris]
MNSKAKGGEILTPLLPELHPLAESTEIKDSGGGASFSSAVFNISTSIIGAGIMSIPATLRVLGVVPALFIMVAVGLLCDVSVEFLTRYSAAGESSATTSYSGLMAKSFGLVGSAGLQIFVALTNLGSLIMYLIIIGDVLSGNRTEGEDHMGVLQEWFGEEWWTARSATIPITVVVVMLPLVLLRRVDSLRFTSAVSILLAVIFVLISSGMAIYALFQGNIRNPRLLPDLHNQSFLQLFTAIPVIVVAFTFHFNVHPIRSELSRVTDMKPAVRVSLILCTLIYATVGLSGYLLFGDDTMSDVLSNFDKSSASPILDDAVRLSYALHLVLVFPLLFYSLRLNIDGLVFRNSQQRPLTADAGRFLSLTAILLALVYVAAIAIPNVWTVFQFIGSTTAVGISLIFPGAVVLRDLYGISKSNDKLLAGIMIILAVITSCIAIYSNIISLFDGELKSSPSVLAN